MTAFPGSFSLLGVISTFERPRATAVRRDGVCVWQAESFYTRGSELSEAPELVYSMSLT